MNEFIINKNNNFIISKVDILNDMIEDLAKLIALNVVLDTYNSNKKDIWVYQGYRLVHKVYSDTQENGLYGIELKFKKKDVYEYKTLPFWMNNTNFMSYFNKDDEGEIQNIIEFNLYEIIEKIMNELKDDGKLSRVNFRSLKGYVMYSEWFKD